MIFIDLKKAYDKIPRNIMWWTLKRKLVPTKYVTLIKDMYTNVMTCVRACDGESDTFSYYDRITSRVSIESIYFHLSDGRDHKRHTRRYSLVYALC
jgi:hypothetical protein